MVRIIFALVLFQLSFSQDYWQQHVDYEMNINVDVSDFTYDGDQSIVYTNNSNDTINKVYYHLFFNAFKPNRCISTGLVPIAQPPGNDTLAFLNLERSGPKTITPALMVFSNL